MKTSNLITCLTFTWYSIFITGCLNSSSQDTTLQKKADSLQTLVNQLQNKLTESASCVSFDLVPVDSLNTYLRENTTSSNRNLLLADLTKAELKNITIGFESDPKLNGLMAFIRAYAETDSIPNNAHLVVSNGLKIVTGLLNTDTLFTPPKPPPKPKYYIAVPHVDQFSLNMLYRSKEFHNFMINPTIVSVSFER